MSDAVCICVCTCTHACFLFAGRRGGSVEELVGRKACCHEGSVQMEQWPEGGWSSAVGAGGLFSTRIRGQGCRTGAELRKFSAGASKMAMVNLQ